ncbi:MAG: hypothetical protein IPH62_11050 [Ignavibacteriae bacterium]|nr:hypothetical protein [Ignavibacteriota bacterium]
MENYNTNRKDSSNQIELLNTKYPQQKKVKLNLDMQSRYIGFLDTSKSTFITTRKKTHLFRRTNSIGLNANLLTSKDIQFEWIRIDFEGKILETSREYFLKKGKLFSFKNKGFEQQAFLPIDEFGRQKASELKNERCIQQDLFLEVA